MILRKTYPELYALTGPPFLAHVAADFDHIRYI